MGGWYRRLERATDEDRSKKDFVLSCVRHEGLALKLASLVLRGDVEVLEAALKQDPLALKFASEALRGNRSLVLGAVSRNGAALAYATAPLRGDEEVALAAVRSNGLALKYASKELRGRLSVARAAVEQNGLALEHARSFLRDNRDLVLVAVKRTGLALEFASPELKKDLEVCCSACRNNPSASKFIEDDVIKAKSELAGLSARHDAVLEATKENVDVTAPGPTKSLLNQFIDGLNSKKDRKTKKPSSKGGEDSSRPLHQERLDWADKTAEGGKLYRMIEGWRADNMDAIIKRKTLDLGDPWERKSEKQKLAPLAPPPVAAPTAGGTMQQQARTVMSLVKKEVYSGPEPDIVGKHIAAIIENLTGVEIDNDAPIMESGVDSLMAVELRTTLQNDFKVTLGSTVMFNYPTIAGLTDYLVGELTTNQVPGWGKMTIEEVMEEVTVMENVMVPQQTQQQARTVMSLVKKEVYSGPQLELVSAHITSLIEKLVGETIELDTPIMESGVDSLMSVELRTQLQNDFKVSLSSTVMFNYPTIGGLADYLVGELTTNQVPGWGTVTIEEVMEEVTIMEDVPVQMGAAEAAAPAPAAAAPVAVYQPPDEALVREYIVSLVKDMTGIDDLEGDTPLMESGLDSLASVDLRTSLQKEFNLDLPSTVMFNYPTTAGLSGYLVEQMEMKQISWGAK